MKTKLLPALSALALVLGLAALGLAGGEIEIKGSTTVLPLMQKVAEAYMTAYPGSNISLSGGGSSEGAKALIDGTCDIAMLSRDLKDEEIKAASAKHRPPRQIVVAYDCWEQKIMHSGGQKSRVFAWASIQASNGAVAQVVSKNGLAIGYVGLGYLNRELKAVSVNGVFGSARTAMDKTFPIARSLILATPGEPRGEPKAMIDFMLSAKGQKLVVEAGFVPLR